MKDYSENNATVTELPCYKTSDGKLHECESKAKEHQANIVGELLDKLMPYGLGNVTASDRFRLICGQLEDDDLNKKITALYNALNPDY